MNEYENNFDKYSNIRSNIPEYDPETHQSANPWEYFREETGDPNKKPFTFTESERKQLEDGPYVHIELPEDFKLSQDNLNKALEKVSNSRESSVLSLMREGVRASKIDPEIHDIKMDRIVGTNDDRGFSGLVEGLGEPSSNRIPSVSEVQGYVEKFLKMGKYEQRKFFQGVDLACYQDEEGNRSYYVYSDGRHRTMTFKALAEMGCNVEFRQMPVTMLVKPPEN